MSDINFELKYAWEPPDNSIEGAYHIIAMPISNQEFKAIPSNKYLCGLTVSEKLHRINDFIESEIITNTPEAVCSSCKKILDQRFPKK